MHVTVLTWHEGVKQPSSRASHQLPHCCCLPLFSLLSALRDILLRTTRIKDLPQDIWTANNAMTCAAGASNLQGGHTGGGRSKLVMPALLGGSASLLVEPASEPGWVKVTLSSSGSGWLGFGVADPGAVYCSTGRMCGTTFEYSRQAMAG